MIIRNVSIPMTPLQLCKNLVIYAAAKSLFPSRKYLPAACDHTCRLHNELDCGWLRAADALDAKPHHLLILNVITLFFW